MLSTNILSNLNNQITAEFEASHTYLQMAFWFEFNNFKGFAKYMCARSIEEREHVLKFSKYILDNLNEVSLSEISAPTTAWQDVLAIFTDIVEQEKKVTSLINNIYKIAMLEGDYATMSFLNWFVAEQ